MTGTPLLLALACVPEQRTVQALVDARAEQLALDARMPVRLALASGGIGAQLAPLSFDGWSEMTEVELREELADVLGIGEPGYVQANEGTGAIRVTWPEVEFTPEIIGRVDIDVLRPQTHFVIGFAQNPGEPPGIYGDGSVTVEGEASGDPELRVDFDLRVGRTSQHVDMPARPDQEFSDSGRIIDPPIWQAGGAFMPLAGDFRWSRTVQGQAQEMTSLDAGEAVSTSWPVIAASEDWEHLVEVDLARE